MAGHPHDVIAAARRLVRKIERTGTVPDDSWRLEFVALVAALERLDRDLSLLREAG